MHALDALIGRQCPLSETGGALRQAVVTARAAAVGAYQVACSDEAEWEGVEAFQRLVASGLLPALGSGCRAPFRTVNLGARYETGALRTAEEHFALAGPADQKKLVLAKINAHVGVIESRSGAEYGRLKRFDGLSTCCGALGLVLSGSALPAARELARALASGGRDRLAALRDENQVPPSYRALAAAIASARLQARRAVSDVWNHRPKTPTTYLVVPCVTFNTEEPASELLVGRSTVDWTGQEPAAEYRGLGDDPSQYRYRREMGRLIVEDSRWPVR